MAAAENSASVPPKNAARPVPGGKVWIVGRAEARLKYVTKTIWS
jgi:hypothetical protein